MSVYATIRGELKFNSKESFEKAKAILEEGGWIEDSHWRDEVGEDLGPAYQEDQLRIEIPQFYHRNLLHILDQLTALSSYYDILWASTDGMFDGGVISSGENTTVKLEEWAKNNGIEKPDQMEDDQGGMSDDALNWQEEVIQAFMEDPGDF